MTITATRITPNTSRDSDAYIVDELDRRYDYAVAHPERTELHHAAQQLIAAQAAYARKWAADDAAHDYYSL